ncbi:TPA: DUF3265 domain-containing protein [Vibrio vulnificus]|nr:DUF3265 domain-containing protein [Vibrio vulnificus]HDY8077022.1 DUF3265 domain-containing protein [Vibrio vulnificus]
MVLTSALRRIRNAWHFYHALILVIKVVCRNIVLRCSPLKRALVCKRKNAAISQGLVVNAQSLSCRIGFQF